MTSTDATMAEPLANDAKSNSVNDAKPDDEDINSTPKRAKLDEAKSSETRKSRSSGKNKRSDAMMIAEAKAAFGDLDTSEGRRLRKRSTEVAKVEEKKPTPKRTSSRRKGSAKGDELDEELTEDTAAEKKNGSDEKLDDSIAKTDGDAESKPEEEKDDKDESVKEVSKDKVDDTVKENEDKSVASEKTEEKEEKQSAEDDEKEKESDETPTSD